MVGGHNAPVVKVLDIKGYWAPYPYHPIGTYPFGCQLFTLPLKKGEVAQQYQLTVCDARECTAVVLLLMFLGVDLRIELVSLG